LFASQLQSSGNGKSHKGVSLPQKLLHGSSLEDSLIDNLLNFAGTPKVRAEAVVDGIAILKCLEMVIRLDVKISCCY